MNEIVAHNNEIINRHIDRPPPFMQDCHDNSNLIYNQECRMFIEVKVEVSFPASLNLHKDISLFTWSQWEGPGYVQAGDSTVTEMVVTCDGHTHRHILSTHTHTHGRFYQVPTLVMLPLITIIGGAFNFSLT